MAEVQGTCRERQEPDTGIIITEGNAWNYDGVADAICITTNGYVTKDGRAVMGRGIAKEAKERLPGIDLELGRLLKEEGNVPHILGMLPGGSLIVSFPVKPESVLYDGGNVVEHIKRRWKLKKGQVVPGWAAKADLFLIFKSAILLREMADRHSWKQVILPRPGCRAGELDWELVKPVIKDVLDDRFLIIQKPHTRRFRSERDEKEQNIQRRPESRRKGIPAREKASIYQQRRR